MYETIPFKSFVAGNISPSMPIEQMLDGGLTFFVSTGAVLLGLVILEKCGVPINQTVVKWMCVGGLVFSFLWAVFKNPLFRRLVAGF